MWQTKEFASQKLWAKARLAIPEANSSCSEPDKMMEQVNQADTECLSQKCCLVPQCRMYVGRDPWHEAR